MKKILLFCSDVVGTSMAGPAIRYWEFAKALSKNYDVTLSTPNIPDLPPQKFTIKPRSQHSLHKEIANCDVLVTQGVTYDIAWTAKRNGVKIILDAYDPVLLEYLELFKPSSTHLKTFRNQQAINGLTLSFQMADAVICANQRQRDLWMGFLMSLGRLTPHSYEQDIKFRHLVDIVPFGLSSTPPKRTGNGLRHKFNLKENDRVLLWGGGIWNWFDPITLIQAVKQLDNERYPVRLVFMGLKHPNPNVPEMQMAAQAVQLAKELNLMDKSVFFNFGWTPYEERQNFLLDADIGVSTHSEHIETEYAFRTRILDYIWAGLPILSTEGDCFADLVKTHQLGMVVAYKNPQAIAQNIKDCIQAPQLLSQMKENLSTIRPQFYWEEVAKPIERMALELTQHPRASMTMQNFKQIATGLYNLRGPAAIYGKIKTYL